MLSRQYQLKHSLKPALSFIKLDNAAHIHFGCSHNLKVMPLPMKHLKNYRRNVFSSGLQMRHESTSSPMGPIQNETTTGSGSPLDPLPEPPIPLSEITKSAVEINKVRSELQTTPGTIMHSSAESFPIDHVSNTYSSSPDIYKTAMEVWKNAELLSEVSTDASRNHYPLDPLSSSPDVLKVAFEVFSNPDRAKRDLETAESAENSSDVILQSSPTPEIYKTAVEIWRDETSEPVVFSSVGSKVVDKEEIILESSSFSQQLLQGHTANTASQVQGSTHSAYTGIFDSLPEPPVLKSQIISNAESFASEPTFASLGLGGRSPVGLIQNCLEYLHVDCGLPWWGAVLCGTIVIRLLMFPIVIIAQRNGARLNNHLPQVQHLQMKVTEAKQRGDKLDVARYSTELMKFMNEKNINPIKNMLPPLCQAPVFISMFMGLRAMATLPVESLKTGGALWFVDLTVPDQFYLLPLITSATLYTTLKIGAETGQASQNMIIMKYVMMGLPVFLFPFTLSFPGLMLVYWTSSNFISLVQVGFLRIPKVRKFFKIEKIVRHQTTKLPIQDKGFMNNLKEAWSNIKVTSELEQRDRADRMAFLKAGREPIKKTYKYDPTKVIQSAPLDAKKRG